MLGDTLAKTLKFFFVQVLARFKNDIYLCNMDDLSLMAYQGLQTATGLIGSYASAMTGYKNNRKLMLLQNELNQQAIDKANEYNLPINQMARLSQAGLNPNLVYGNGSVVGNTAEPAKTGLGHSEMPKYEQVLMANNLALQKAQIANIEADTHLKEENALTQGSVRKEKESHANYMDYFTSWNYLTWDEREQTIKLQNAISKRQFGLIGYYMQNIASQIDQRGQITEQQVQTMAQARQMQLKEFELRKQDLAQQWQHWKNQDSIGFQNVKAMLISALASQLGAEASKGNVAVNWYNAETQRKYFNLAQDKFSKMSDLEQAKLYEEVLNKMSYRENYLQYLGPLMEGKILLNDSMYDSNRQRLQNYQQQYDFGVPNMMIDFLNFGVKYNK